MYDEWNYESPDFFKYREGMCASIFDDHGNIICLYTHLTNSENPKTNDTTTA